MMSDVSDDHDIEHEARDAVLHESIGVFFLNDALFLQAAEDILYQQREDGREEEVEAPDERPEGIVTEVPQHAGLDDGVHAAHEEVGKTVGTEDQRQLHREFVHGFGKADLALPGDGLHGETFFLIIGGFGLDDPFAPQTV